MQIWQRPSQKSAQFAKAKLDVNLQGFARSSQLSGKENGRPQFQHEAFPAQREHETPLGKTAKFETWSTHPSGSMKASNPWQAVKKPGRTTKARAEQVEAGHGSLTFPYRAHEEHARRQRQAIAAQFGAQPLELIIQQQLSMPGTTR